MNIENYLAHFEEILSNTTHQSPYDDPAFLNYTKLNWSRMNRWLKKGAINDELKTIIQQIAKPQQWILIVEPWCGDAAHSVPFLFLMAQLNSTINLDIQLRDSATSPIDSYLTNGTKSIPILVIRDQQGKDLAVWGPRPEACKLVQESLKAQNIPVEELKIALQNWYNADGGKSVQQEMGELIKSTL